MAFHYCERHRDEYVTDGFTVLRGVIPASLLTDLRREAEKAREIARGKQGPQTQRLQPVYAYDELNHQPFRDFLTLPGMAATVEGILGKGHGPTQIMGILLEPEHEAWCTHWHRDWGYNVPDLDMNAFFEAARNLTMFNQLNGALYDDHSLWVVPGSHNREDTAEERAVFPVVPPPGPTLTAGMSAEERERACLEYARSMPGATQVVLCAGDVAFYRACCWHIGNYVPYARRATLHDGYYGPEDYAWRENVPKMQAAVRAAREAQSASSP